MKTGRALRSRIGTADTLAPRWLASPRRLAACLLALLAAGELLVVARYAPLLGSVLLGSTAGLGLVARHLAHETASRAADAARDQLRTASEGFLIDADTRLPNRQHLIDHLTREIARSQRYSHEMTLTTVEISRLREVQTAWGAETSRKAVQHVAETLRRVTRTSDFVARVGEDRFVVALMQCDARQAEAFGERVALAVSNRPLRATAAVKVPLYVSVECSALQYEAAKFRGPLDFLSAAGGDVAPFSEGRRTGASPRGGMAADPQSLRRQLVRDYYPEGKMADFADAYREQRQSARRVI
jgi:diguanylate cyclase (GGDEF)-like protein